MEGKDVTLPEYFLETREALGTLPICSGRVVEQGTKAQCTYALQESSPDMPDTDDPYGHASEVYPPIQRPSRE